MHEHTRPDRDRYVTVKWENIKKGQLLTKISARVVFLIPNTLEVSNKETLNGLFPPINADEVNLIQFVESYSTRRRLLLINFVKEDFGFVQREQVGTLSNHDDVLAFFHT